MTAALLKFAYLALFCFGAVAAVAIFAAGYFFWQLYLKLKLEHTRRDSWLKSYGIGRR
jgi:hypothetical protein